MASASSQRLERIVRQGLAFSVNAGAANQLFVEVKFQEKLLLDHAEHT